MLLKVSVKENEVSAEKNEIIAPLFFVQGQTVYHNIKPIVNYLNKLLVLMFLFGFEASNSERLSLLQKFLHLHFIAKINALCCIFSNR